MFFNLEMRLRVSLKCDARESALLRQVRLIIQSRPSAAHCHFVFVSLRTPGANHKCVRYRPGDGPFKAIFERIEAAGLAAGAARGAEHLGGLAAWPKSGRGSWLVVSWTDPWER